MVETNIQVYRNIVVKTTHNAGRALAVKESRINEGEEILKVQRPLSALDSKHLQDACSNCYFWISGNDQDDTSGADRVELKACLACNVVKYCSKTCQSRAWKDGHKYECSVYKALHPNVLPNTVRLLLRPLLRFRNHDLSTKTWEDLLDLNTHLQALKAKPEKNSDGLTKWDTLLLMGQALAKYSATTESLERIQSLLAIVMLNSHTLTTPTLDPLGLAIDPLTALLNHSCDPNAYLIFDGNILILRSLKAIAKDEEITIAYIDTTNPTSIRRAELKDRYFFGCTCPECWKVDDVTPDPTITIAGGRAVKMAMELQQQAASQSPREATIKLRTAVNLLEREKYPRMQQPFSALYHSLFLSAVASQDWMTALVCATQMHIEIEPTLYPELWHPVRVVRTWVFLRTVVHIAGLVHEKDQSVKKLRQADVDLRAIAWLLWNKIQSQVDRSHGPTSRFSKQVVTFGENVGLVGTEVKDATGQWDKFERALVAIPSDDGEDHDADASELRLRVVHPALSLSKQR